MSTHNPMFSGTDYRDLNAEQLSKYLRDYASERKGEIAELTLAAANMIDVLLRK